ncbi:SET domain-containing protein-lysine N-methyltransferase [Pseudomonas palleroniana]|uniref:SET domain-containing protein-lysine N-methyltransferase n=1 Tax=Pseudomonas palleroniana TaxID=191390 RepID=UPI0018E6C00F|nr:SET domain-containing protein-lysine N-methyltransferase [Pseudomonas palleroniana]MBI6909269.1 SET domain-containing protein [Pseudomonas palleroniana]
MDPLSLSIFCRKRPAQLDTLYHLIDAVTPLASSASSAAAASLYYRPLPGSELGRQCQAAFTTLQKLEADEDFVEYLHNRQPSQTPYTDTLLDSLTALVNTPRQPKPAIPEVFTLCNQPVVLRDIPTYWTMDAEVLLAILHRVGDGLKSDGSVRFDLALKYYGLVPHSPATPAQWSTLLDTLRECCALLALGHADYSNDLESLLGDAGDAIIVGVTRALEEEHGKSLFSHILPDTFFAPQQKLARSQPTALLSEYLHQPHSLAVGRRIVSALDWFGADPTQDCPRAVLVKLVWRALWLSIKPHDTAQYDNELNRLIAPCASYAQIRESLLHDYQRELGVDAHGAALVLCVAKAHIASEVWVDGIPDELSYGTTSAWVHFKSGFLLAECLEPGASRVFTFDELHNLSAEYFRACEGDTRRQTLVTLARLPPTLHWAQANGLLPVQKQRYTPEQVTQAVAALERHEREVIEAIKQIVLRPPGRAQFNSDQAHDTAFYAYLQTPKAAYKKLIKTLLAQIPPSVGDIERDEVRVYALREPLRDVEANFETPRRTSAVRGRTGFILRLSNPRLADTACYIEVFPALGVIRVRDDIRSLLIGGVVKTQSIGAATRRGKGTFRCGTLLAFDWPAYRNGATPRPGQHHTLIAEPVGEVLAPLHRPVSQVSRATNHLYGARAEALAQMIAEQHFFCDEATLLENIREATKVLDIGEYLVERMVFWGKILVPFWGAIEDLNSSDPERVALGGLGFFADIVGFALPIGKYVAGSARVMVQSGRAGIRLALPALKTLTRQLIIQVLDELNPLSALPTLLQMGHYYSLKLFYKTLNKLGEWADEMIPASRLIPVNPADWAPRQAGDRLFVVADTPNVPLRNVGSTAQPDWRLIDAASDSVFGPRFREPVTVMSNSDPHISRYAVSAHWISGLKPDSRGIFHRREYGQAFVCNIDERGEIAVYQIREHSYGYLKEIAEGSANSFTVALINPKTNRDLGIRLSSVQPGHWFSSPTRLAGGAPDGLNVLTPPTLQKWSAFSEMALKLAADAFIKKHNLDPAAFHQFVHTRGELRGRGQEMLDQANRARVPVALKNLQRWRRMPQAMRVKRTREGYAHDHNLDPQAFIDHVNMDGSFTPLGKVLEKHSLQQSFSPLTRQDLEDWHRLHAQAQAQPHRSMEHFLDQRNLNPVKWRQYVEDNGQLTQAGRLAVFFDQPLPNTPLARKRTVPAPAASPSKDSTTQTSPREPDTEQPTLAAKRSRTHYDADRPDGHQINNAAPILQDPYNVNRSLTAELEGAVEQIRITNDCGLFDGLREPKRQRVIEAVTEDIQDWITKEGRHHDLLSELFEVKKLDDGPERGYSLVARRDIQHFDVLGPYTGRLHLNDASLSADILEHGMQRVSDYLFQTATEGATISGHGNSNMLSLINTGQMPGAPRVGNDNVAAVYAGKYMVFLIAKDDIRAGSELLMDYGPAYWQRPSS